MTANSVQPAQPTPPPTRDALAESEPALVQYAAEDDLNVDVSHVLEATRRVCERAMASSPGGIVTRRYRFAGRPVRLRVAGPVLAEHMHNTWAHLHSDDEQPDDPAELRIDMWDRAHTGLGCPGVPYIPESTECLDAGLITRYCRSMVVRYERGHCTTCLDRPAQHILSCRNSGEELALYERSKPFPIMLARWYQDRGVQQLHAGLVSRDGAGVLFIGKSGSGKSTCTLACSLAYSLEGFDYLGDDFVGLELAGDQCIGHSFYNAARIDDEQVRRFPELAPHEVKPVCQWDYKSLVYVSQLIGERMASRTRVSAIVMPRITGGQTRFRKASKIETLIALAPSTLKVPMSAGARGFLNLTEFIARMPCYTLELGPDVREIPQHVGKLLDQALSS